MSRSKWKGPFLKKFLFKKLSKYKYKKVWKRSLVIPLKLLGTSILIYNGKKFRKILITRDKIGFKFGEFCFTRILKKKIHKKTQKKKKKK